MIAGVATILNEADLLEYTLRHLAAEGVDRVYIAHGPSTDGTAEILKPERWADGFIHVVDDPSPIHYQPKWISELARLAGEDGAEWIIPFDADEFWYAVDGSSIAMALDNLGSDIRTVGVPMIRHLTWDTRQEISTLPKIAFRYEPGVWVANGNHECSVRGGQATGVLALRELCYRGFDHFVRKTRERNATIDPTLPGGEGAHQRQYAGMDEDQLRVAWNEYCALPHFHDPVPSQIVNTPKW